MKLFRNIFLFLILAAMVACGGGSYDQQLVEIDSLTMKGEPQKAVEMLKGLDKDEFSTADRMYFELLRIKACDKAYIEHETDSAVTEIVEYFEIHDKEKLAEAYYYAGSVYRDLNDAQQAVEFFHKCIDVLPDDKLKMKSNACYQCGQLFRFQHLQAQAVRMFQEAYRYDSLAGNTQSMIDCLAEIGGSFALDFKDVQAEEEVLPYFKRALAMAKENGSEESEATISANIAFIYCALEQYENAAKYLPSVERFLKDNEYKQLENDLLEIRASLLMKEKDYEAALPICQSLAENGEGDQQRLAYGNLFTIYAEKHDYAKANQYKNLFKKYTDSLSVAKAQDATAQANALYNYQLRERDNMTLKAENQERLYFILILLTVIVAVLLTFWIYRLRQKQKRQILHQQIARLRQFEKMRQEQSEAAAANQDFTRQKLFDSEIYMRIRQLIAENKSLSDTDIALLDDTVNQIYGGFKSTLYSAYNLSAQEYAICLLLKLELSATDISHLLNRTNSAITMGRKRLFRKLFGRDGDANELDAYIRSL